MKKNSLSNWFLFFLLIIPLITFHSCNRQGNQFKKNNSIQQSSDKSNCPPPTNFDAYLVGNIINFSWQSGGGGAVDSFQYIVEVNGIDIDSAVININNASFTLPVGIPPNADIVIKIRSICEDGSMSSYIYYNVATVAIVYPRQRCPDKCNKYAKLGRNYYKREDYCTCSESNSFRSCISAKKAVKKEWEDIYGCKSK